VPERRFLIASSFARLIRKERGVVDRIVEGYFPARSDRDHFVSIEPGHSYLVLGSSGADGTKDEERTEVPRAHAEALLAVCTGKVGFECTRIRLATDQDAMLERYIAPGALDLVRVEFPDARAAAAFSSPAWFGDDVSDDPGYERAALAGLGIPDRDEVAVSNPALEQLLDLLENGFGAYQFGSLPFARTSENSRNEASPEGGRRSASLESARLDSVAAGLAEALDLDGSDEANEPNSNRIVPLERVEARGRR
jgi:CYTH domain-containing protein